MTRWLLVGATAVLAAGGVVLTVVASPWWTFLAVVLVAVAALGIHDLVQTRHNILRNYPVLGHMRFLLESIRPELQQYFIERNFDGRPYDRDTRSLIYQRAKDLGAESPFGTERDVNEVGYEYLIHSAKPAPKPDAPPRIRIGGPDCTQPYDMAFLNVSAMSFGALSANALRALNKGAHKGNFAHDTGEGGLSDYHLENTVTWSGSWARATSVRGPRTATSTRTCSGTRPRTRRSRWSRSSCRRARSRYRRCAAGAEGHRRDRPGTRRPAGSDGRVTLVPPGVLDTARAGRVHRAHARACGRQAGRGSSSASGGTATCSRSARRWSS